jgi:hypothetical protein
MLDTKPVGGKLYEMFDVNLLDFTGFHLDSVIVLIYVMSNGDGM